MSNGATHPVIDAREHEPVYASDPKPLEQWRQLGQQALRLETRGERRKLRAILGECAQLAIIEVWLANHQNRTRAAEELGVSRRVVRNAVRAWEAAQKARG